VKDRKEKPSFEPWPHFAEDEIQAVTRVLRSGQVNQWTGSEVTSFEHEFAEYLGVRHAVALANGSVALDLALRVLGIGPGDEVIVTPRTFVASAGCIALSGALPVFADVDPVSQNIVPSLVERAITGRTRAVIAVHLAGWPCELDQLRHLCDEHRIYLIEDCAQAHGARSRGRAAGSFGDLAAFSFCQDKIMTTGGEGGLLATNDERLWKKAWSFKDHGKDIDLAFRNNHPPGFRWLVRDFGTNYRMTEMQAAIGRIQLGKLDHWVDTRRVHASVLDEGFQGIPGLRATVPPEEVYHSYYKYYAFVRTEALKRGWSRDRILHELTERGVPCSVGSCSEVYLEEGFRKQPVRLVCGSGETGGGRLPVARELGETSLMFLVHPTLTLDDMHLIVEKVREVFGLAGR